MAKEAVTFRIDPEKRKRLDSMAAALKQDRSEAIDQAIEAYLDFHEWQVEQIRAGLADAEAGRFVSDEDMDDIWRKLSRAE